MKYIVKFAFVVVVALFMEACYYDNPPELLPFDCEDVSYSTHVMPIMVASCATSGCHDGTVPPDLRSEVSYNELKNGGFISLVNPDESTLFKTVDWQESPMPPGVKLTQTNIDIIYCWITEGAPNN